MHGSQAAVGGRDTAPASASQRIPPRRVPWAVPPRPGPARSPAGAGRPRAHPIAGRSHRDAAGMTCSAAAPARRTGPRRRSVRWASRACRTGLPRLHRRSPGATPRHRPGRPGQSPAGPSRQAHGGSPAQPELSAALVQLLSSSFCVWLPGQVPVEPLQRWPDHRLLMPASRHDLPADRFGGTAQRLAHHGGLLVPCPAPQKMDAADADADFGMVAEVDQGVLRPGLAAAPASAFAGLAFRCLSCSGHGGSRLLPASVGADDRRRLGMASIKTWSLAAESRLSCGRSSLLVRGPRPSALGTGEFAEARCGEERPVAGVVLAAGILAFQPRVVEEALDLSQPKLVNGSSHDRNWPVTGRARRDSNPQPSDP